MSETGPNAIPTGGTPQQPIPAGAPQPGYGAPQPGYGAQPPYVAQPAYEAPKPKKKFNVVGLLIALLLVGGGAAWGMWQTFQRDQLLAVGNCVVLSGKTEDAKADEAKCDDTTKATFKVVSVKKDGTECGDDFAEYYVTQKGKRIAAYCMVPNMLENKCYVLGNGILDYKMVECTDPSASIKIAKRVDGTTDTTQCPADTKGYAPPLANVVYCVAPPA